MDGETDAEDPFGGMAISDTSILERIEGRSACPRCFKSRKYFCYGCRVPVAELSGRLPVVELPVRIDIVKHRREIDGKSTSAHAAVLAPGQVTVYEYPDEVPDYGEEPGACLAYPDPEAVEPDGLPGGAEGIRRIVFVDGTWNQSKGMRRDRRLARLPRIVLRGRPSQFWRHQRGSPRWYLATVEAVHQALLEIHASAWGVSPAYRGPRPQVPPRPGDVSPHPSRAYAGQYDDLLFFFSFMYRKIRTHHDADSLLAYRRPF